MQYEKVFVDTNVILSPNFDFGKYKKVYIAITSIEELDGLKYNETVGYQARKAIKNIINADNVEVKISYSFGGTNKFFEHKNDNIILAFAYETYTLDNHCIFLTDDYNLFLKAKTLNLPCSLFENKDDKEIYIGIKYIEIEDPLEDIESIVNNINMDELLENQYVLIGNWIYDEYYEQKQFKAIKSYRYTNGHFENVRNPRLGENLNNCFKDNAEQRLVYDAINNDDIDIIIVYGEAGTGKDFSVLANCFNNVCQPTKNKKGNYKTKSILYTRSTIEVGQKQGYLPGDAYEKCEIYMQPARQNLNKILNILDKQQTYEDLINAKLYQEEPLAYIRGCTYDNKYMILDESANCTVEEVKTFISRAGQDTKVIILGSLNQIDNKNNTYTNNGLYKVIEAFKGQKNCAIIKLRNQHRSKLARQADKLLI